MEFVCFGCPHLGASVIRGFTVINNIIKAMHDTILVTTGVEYFLECNIGAIMYIPYSHKNKPLHLFDLQVLAQFFSLILFLPCL